MTTRWKEQPMGYGTPKKVGLGLLIWLPNQRLLIHMVWPCLHFRGRRPLCVWGEIQDRDRQERRNDTHVLKENCYII